MAASVLGILQQQLERDYGAYFLDALAEKQGYDKARYASMTANLHVWALG